MQTFKYTTKSSANRKIKTLAANQNYTLEKAECGSWIVTIQQPEPISLFDKVAAKLPETCQLIYVDYNENLNETKELKEVITLNKKESQGAIDALMEKVWDCYLDNRDAENAEIKEACGAAGVCFYCIDDDVIDNLTEVLRDRDESNPLEDLLKNTQKQRIRIELTNKWERFCDNDHSDYLALLLEFLRINPRDYANKMGFDDAYDWPVIEYENGPLIDINLFIQEVENHASGLGEWVFYGVIDAADVMELSKEGAFITLPKGMNCGLFEGCYGSGSLLGCELLETINIDDHEKFLLTHDELNGYGIEKVYGLTWDAWDNTISVELPETIDIVLPFNGFNETLAGEYLDIVEKGGKEGHKVTKEIFFRDWHKNMTAEHFQENERIYLATRNHAKQSYAVAYCQVFAHHANLKTLKFESYKPEYDSTIKATITINELNSIYNQCANHEKWADFVGYEYDCPKIYATQHEKNVSHLVDPNAWGDDFKKFDWEQITNILRFYVAFFCTDEFYTPPVCYQQIRGLYSPDLGLHFYDEIQSELEGKGFLNYAINECDWWDQTGDFAPD